MNRIKCVLPRKVGGGNPLLIYLALATVSLENGILLGLETLWAGKCNVCFASSFQNVCGSCQAGLKSSTVYLY